MSFAGDTDKEAGAVQQLVAGVEALNGRLSGVTNG